MTENKDDFENGVIEIYNDICGRKQGLDSWDELREAGFVETDFDRGDYEEHYEFKRRYTQSYNIDNCKRCGSNNIDIERYRSSSISVRCRNCKVSVSSKIKYDHNLENYMEQAINDWNAYVPPEIKPVEKWSTDFNAIPKHTPVIIQQEVVWDVSMDEPRKYVGKPICWRVK